MFLKPKYILFLALFIVVVIHGTTIFFTLGKTYDAYVHIFFADHYARSWWDPWEYRWYTGFPTISYPPLSHMLMGVLSYAIGLKIAFVSVMLTTLMAFVLGVFRFSKLFVSIPAASLAALYAALASSVIQTVHIYGQLPTMMGITALLHTLPFIYDYIKDGKNKSLWLAIAIMSVGITSHHVTTIFGMVFFIAPVIATALLDQIDLQTSIWQTTRQLLNKAWEKKIPIMIIGGMAIFLVVFLIFPYWYWSRTDPISQVPIPHGSRENFIKRPEMGMMFFVIPWGLTFIFIPYILKSLWTRRNAFFCLSFILLFILGTGGTTPIPRMLLGDNAFNILTLDRFTFWASMMSLPFVGSFFMRLVDGSIRTAVISLYSQPIFYTLSGLVIGIYMVQAFLLLNYHQFKSLQPDPINIAPIVKFIEEDEHYRWRFMTLGFGDQMAWLSANTRGLSIDGNYHSARRVPEMTTRPLERLENSKFKGIQGLGSLQQFLTVSDKYHLKYIFSNDKFYDPILHFTGWERLTRLDNGIMIWQKPNIKPLPALLPRNDIPTAHKIMWGTIPLSTVFIMIAVLLWYRPRKYQKPRENVMNDFGLTTKRQIGVSLTWALGLVAIAIFVLVKNMVYDPQKKPIDTIEAYYDALNKRDFRKAYSFFVPGMESYDDYSLQNSVSDGIIESYGSLDSLQIDMNFLATKAEAEVRAYYNTPLESYDKEDNLLLQLINDRWYIIPPQFDYAIPPDRIHTSKSLNIHSLGKRTLVSDLVEHDDIVDRPRVKVLFARLIKVGDEYKVIGEIQNIDSYPAHITNKARLFDKDGNELVSYNTRYKTKHVLLPDQISPFMIEFEETAWVDYDDENPLQFDPSIFTPFHFDRQPTTFKLMVESLVSDKNYLAELGITNVGIEKGNIVGRTYNAGIENITIPQLLVSYYDSNKNIIWVDHSFLPRAVGSQKSTFFEVPIDPSKLDVEVIYSSDNENINVNSMAQEDYISVDYTLDRSPILWPLDDSHFYSLCPNGYIANPTIY